MSLHAYAAVGPEHQPLSCSGIDGSGIEVVRCESIAVVVSRHETGPEPTAKNIAAHYQVQVALLKAGAIVPFRFGNVFSSEEHLGREIKARGKDLCAKLEHLAGCVELTVRLPRPHSDLSTDRPGTHYLRARKQQEDAENRLKAELDDLVKDWRHDRRGAEIRLACLVELRSVPELRRRTAHLAVTGPWPPSSFV